MTDSYNTENLRIEHFTTRIETILERVLQNRTQSLNIYGSSSSLALSLLLANSTSKSINNLPHLVVVPSSEEAQQLLLNISAFDPTRKVHVLPHYDVSPYSGLYPRPQVTCQRLGFLFHAQNAKPGEIFVASVGSLLQKTLPFKKISAGTIALSKGTELFDRVHDRLAAMGYISAPIVEDVGQYAMRGGILDIFSPNYPRPIRIELFGDVVESLRHFSTQDQRSQGELNHCQIIPAREYLFDDDHLEDVIKRFRKNVGGRNVEKSELDDTLRSLARGQSFPGIEFLLPFFYDELEQPISHFSESLNVWMLDPLAITNHADQILSEMKDSFRDSPNQLIRPAVDELFVGMDSLAIPDDSFVCGLYAVEISDKDHSAQEAQHYRTFSTIDFSNIALSTGQNLDTWIQSARSKIKSWKDDGYRIFISYRNQAQKERIKLLLERMDLTVRLVGEQEYLWQTWSHEQDVNPHWLHLIPHRFFESQRIPEEKLIFLKDEDFFGKKIKSKASSDSDAAEDFHKQAKRLSFGDLKPGDCVVHVLHGVGVYEGLKVMSVNGADSEFIQVGYRDKDKLYLPVYRVGQLQKYAGAANHTSLDKLGGPGWEKTKTKVKAHLKDVASELLKLYAARAEMNRPKFQLAENEFGAFENAFPYEETNDQRRAILEIIKDLTGAKPMDRLVCGDVGFGKTEVAMRAAFVSFENRKQVAVLAPTTVLSFQHLETFKKRFHGWPIDIRALNRFVSPQDTKQTLADVKSGKVDILIGTHRILSKDVEFNNLGMLIIDEEQKFGVTHKERIKKMKSSVDTLTLSATPIPRTLNMSLVGIRDLSLINTAPVDRLPTRTFICKFDHDTIIKAVRAEVARGGQIYFIHNRIQSIYGLADELRQMLPEIRFKVAHGQMEEHELEQTMISFFNHEIDMLVCTAIVESGMDVPRANTMFIDNAQIFGLSQLYQLRGRVGRSKQRAYCYLIVPNLKALDKDAQERLKVIQENTALGSGIRIAQYDLELRGAGDILGEEQSGHINAVGYELYMDLLNEALHHAKGEDVESIELDPEINLRVPAMIPDSYISDIRVRLSFYKALSDISSEEELEQIEEELRDQFGALPEVTVNLLGMMLIRSYCKKLGVRDVSAGLKNISLIFTEKTKIKPETVIQLAMRENKKYSLTPDNRLNIRMNAITWVGVVEELKYLSKL